MMIGFPVILCWCSTTPAAAAKAEEVAALEEVANENAEDRSDDRVQVRRPQSPPKPKEVAVLEDVANENAEDHSDDRAQVLIMSPLSS